MASNAWAMGFKMIHGFSKLLIGAGVLLALSTNGASAHFNTLYRFKTPDDGLFASALIIDKAGNFYGTTIGGGSADKGTVFRLAPDGAKTTLYDFAEADSGAAPLASLLRDKQGNLYGTTQFTNVSGDNGGTMFKLSPDGHETVLHRFAANDPAGNTPKSELIADKSGNLYGTTADGNGICDCGTVFKLAPNGSMTVLHAFTGGDDGYQPYTGLVADRNGNLYGTTLLGGVYPAIGTVFKIATDGTKTTLHSFILDAHDGGAPWGTLIFGKDGNLYGVTFYGGDNDLDYGAVFKITPDGTETLLHSFAGRDENDGAYPSGALVTDPSGNLYGTTEEGGPGDLGTVFKLTPDGREKIIHPFSNGKPRYPTGFAPLVGLVRNSTGNLYGTTSQGNPNTGGQGTIFSIKKSR